MPCPICGSEEITGGCPNRHDIFHNPPTSPYPPGCYKYEDGKIMRIDSGAPCSGCAELTERVQKLEFEIEKIRKVVMEK